jgi:hypothetical protein
VCQASHKELVRYVHEKYKNIALISSLNKVNLTQSENQCEGNASHRNPTRLEPDGGSKFKKAASSGDSKAKKAASGDSKAKKAASGDSKAKKAAGGNRKAKKKAGKFGIQTWSTVQCGHVSSYMA